VLPRHIGRWPTAKDKGCGARQTKKAACSGNRTNSGVNRVGMLP